MLKLFVFALLFYSAEGASSLTYFIVNTPSTMNQSDLSAAARYAFDQWQEVINRNFIQIYNADYEGGGEKERTANITIHFMEQYGTTSGSPGLRKFFDAQGFPTDFDKNGKPQINGIIAINDRKPNWKFYKVGEEIDNGPMAIKSSDIVLALMHEIGVILELKHSWEPRYTRFLPIPDSNGNYILPKLSVKQVENVKKIWTS